MRNRVHYLTNKRMQLGLTLRFLLVTLLFALFVGFEVYITIWPVVSEVIPGNLVALVRYQIVYRVFFFSIPLVFVITAFSIVFTHRIAGPLYRLETMLDRFLKGEDIEDIQLRKEDDLHALAQKINALLSMVRDSKGEAKPAR
jgi:signal transduction histidine kinase